KIAASDYYVVVLDLFYGEPYDPQNTNRPLEEWLKDHGMWLRLHTIFSNVVRLLGSCTEGVCGFDEMVTEKERKYYMLSGKGGVGKTSCVASLAVIFANHWHPTMVVSTDPAHSLSDSFALDLTGGRLVLVEGVESPLYALEINPKKSMEEFRAANKKLGDGVGVKSLMQSTGLGMIAD
ncbi:hypothetical protein S83_058790, partial [Arachis hypogaea]